MTAREVDTRQMTIYRENGPVNFVLNVFTISFVNDVLNNHARMTTIRRMSSILTVTYLPVVRPSTISGDKSIDAIMMIRPISGFIRTGTKTRIKRRNPVAWIEKWLFMAKKLTKTARTNTKKYIKVLFTLIFNGREILL